MNKKILMCGLLTGGHIYPLYALKDYFKDDEITYLVRPSSLEEKILSEQNIIRINIDKSIKNNLLNKDFYKEIKRLKPILSEYDIYFSSGGLSTFLLSFFVKNKPWYLFEQNVILGDANKLFYYKAKKVFLTYEINKLFNKKLVQVGNPSYLRFKNKAKYKNKIVFVFGSLSSQTLVLKTINYFLSSLFIKEYEYVFVCKDTSIKLPKNIEVVPYINMEDYIDESNIFFTRCGGSTSFELIKNNIRACFIPSPYVKHNHQEKNALYFNKVYNYPFIYEKDYNNQNIVKTINKLINIKQINNFNLDTIELIKKHIYEDIQ